MTGGGWVVGGRCVQGWILNVRWLAYKRWLADGLRANVWGRGMKVGINIYSEGLYVLMPVDGQVTGKRLGVDG